MTDGLQMKYFVLNPAKDDAYGEASRKAMLAYSAAIMQENPELATDLFDWVENARAKLHEQNDVCQHEITEEDAVNMHGGQCLKCGEIIVLDQE